MIPALSSRLNGSWLTGRVGPVRAYLGSRKDEDLACSAITVGELASGGSETAVRVLLRRLRKIPVSEAVAYRAAELDKELRLAGNRLGENDNWIAGTALYVRRRSFMWMEISTELTVSSGCD